MFLNNDGLGISLALAHEGEFSIENSEFLSQVTLFAGGLIGLQGDFSIEQGGFCIFQVTGELLALDFSAVEFETDFVQFQAGIFELGGVDFSTRAAGDVAVCDAPAAVGGAFSVEFVDAFERFDTLAHVGGQAFEVAQGIELGLQGFDIQQVFVEQVIMDKGADVGKRAEGQSFDDFGGKGVFELAEPVEQVDAVIFQPGKNLGAGGRRKGEMFEVAFKGAGVE